VIKYALRPILLLSLLSCQLAVSQVDSVEKVMSDKLTYEKIGGKEILTFNGKPFTGIKVDMDRIKGEKEWKAHTTYKDGVLDGEVIVWSQGKELSRFRYDKGKKILPESSEAK